MNIFTDYREAKLGNLKVAVIAEDGLDGPEDVRTLEGHIALDMFVHQGQSPLFLIFHWQRNSSGADVHSVSMVDNLPKAKELIGYFRQLEDMGVNRVLIMLPPNSHTSDQWVVEDFEHATIDNTAVNQAPTVVYKTTRAHYSYSMGDFDWKPKPDWRIILRNM